MEDGDSIIKLDLINNNHTFGVYIHNNGTFKISCYVDDRRYWYI